MFALTGRLGPKSVLPKFLGRQVHNNAEILANISEIKNKNPRNLELLRIARKPAGYHLDKPGREFWHKLTVNESSKHVTVEVIHWENKTVVTASTKEWAVKKQLYRTKDRSAYLNLGRVIAQRCLESGIANVRCDLKADQCEKIKLLLDGVINGGVALEEPTRYIHANPWDWRRYQKPWEVQD